jgi:hypothetical protein
MQVRLDICDSRTAKPRVNFLTAEATIGFYSHPGDGKQARKRSISLFATLHDNTIRVALSDAKTRRVASNIVSKHHQRA